MVVHNFFIAGFIILIKSGVAAAPAVATMRLPLWSLLDLQTVKIFQL